MYIFIYSPTKYIISSHNVQYSYIYFDSMDIVTIFTPDKQITNIIHLLNYNTMQTLLTENKIRSIVNSFLLPLNMSARVCDNGDEIFIEPSTRKTGTLKAGKLDGMQIIYFKDQNIFEVSEYMAGEKENELHIYETTKSLKIALKGLLKGNKRKPSKIWN